MNNSYFNYGNIISDVDDKTLKEVVYTSISYTPNLPLKTSMLKTTILQTENFRPDKISYRLFEDPNLSWILDEINSFYTFSDYYAGREIYYLGPNGLSSINISVDYVSYEMQNY